MANGDFVKDAAMPGEVLQHAAVVVIPVAQVVPDRARISRK